MKGCVKLYVCKVCCAYVEWGMCELGYVFVLQLNPDGYGSHTSPTHHCTRQHLSDDFDEEPFLPKNAKWVYQKWLL